MQKRYDNHPLAFLSGLVQGRSWYEPVRRAFWSDPDRLMAMKATIAMAFLAVPFVGLGKPFFAVSLSLGALAGALSETDDHPKGRIKSMVLKVFCFGFTSLSVELLQPYSVFLGLGLAISTIAYILIGGIGERYRGVTFGAVLVGIYAMIGASNSPAWYWQPILLPAGALFYGVFSLSLLCYRPWRLLEEQLARGFLVLSRYLEVKAALFPSDEKLQGQVRNRLALLNVELVGTLDRCKDVLNSYGNALKDDVPLMPYLRYFMLLQSLHERAAASHERYDLLSRDPAHRKLMEGIGQTMNQLAHATEQLADSLLTGVPYQHLVSLDWMIAALNGKLVKHGIETTHPLVLLINNLSRSNDSLKNLVDNPHRSMVPQLTRETRTLKQRINDQLQWQNPRLRHAIRLSLCFLAGFYISEYAGVSKGEWIILTSLFVCQPSYSETRRRLFQRVLGTFTGVIGGVLIVQLLPTLFGQLLLMLLAAYLFFFWLRRNYAVAVVFITVFVLAAFNLIAGSGEAVMIPRLIATLIGSALALLSVRLLWPDWQDQRLPGLLAVALEKNTAYFQAILNAYRQQQSGDDLDYRIARRQAHRADNALAMAWQDMLVQPRRHRQFREQAFALTYLNHALLSYLSALGAHREQEEATHLEGLDLADDILKVLQQTVACSMTSILDQEVCQIHDLPGAIHQRVLQAGREGGRQLYTLLYNIADVAEQILDQARKLTETSS